MKKITVELSTERFITPGRLALVGASLEKVTCSNKLTRVLLKKSGPAANQGWRYPPNIYQITCLGRTCLDFVHDFHVDPDCFKDTSGISSIEALRQQMDTDKSSPKRYLKGKYLRVQNNRYGTIRSENENLPPDMDVTPFDNSTPLKTMFPKPRKELNMLR